jgi:prolipoprotein diacylglyceryltransferase
MGFSHLLKWIGIGFAAIIAVAGILLLAFAALSHAFNRGPSPDLGYEDPTIRNSSVWAFMGSVLLAAAGYVAFYAMTTG